MFLIEPISNSRRSYMSGVCEMVKGVQTNPSAFVALP